MRALLAPVAVLAALSNVPAALAANPTMSTVGNVRSLSVNAHRLTLKDGSVYHLPMDFRDPGLKIGEKVKVSWTLVNGRHDAIQVKRVK